MRSQPRFGDAASGEPLDPLVRLLDPLPVLPPPDRFLPSGTQPAVSAGKKPHPGKVALLGMLSGQRVIYPVEPVRNYIKAQWRNLLVTNRDLLKALEDPKVQKEPGAPWRLYISEKENPMRVWQELQQALPPQEFQKIQILTLPPPGQRNVIPPGLLYLPHPYVVPGGRFKEMYGWDSYFIQLGLLKDGELKTAKGMADNLLYEINHYGTILNANRTYFVNRSQPPFISEMVLNVFDRTHDVQWLRQAVPILNKHYQYWTSGQHLIPSGPAAGLSRYYAYGEGPALEVLQGEMENGKNHYQRIQDYYRTHAVPDYNVAEYYDRSKGQLTPLFYKGDRTMRESGFDPSNRFGPFNIDIIHYAPVCLNSLLYQMERDMARIGRILDSPAQAAAWEQRAAQRKDRVNQVLWDDQTGLYLDYNFKTNQRRLYPYATTFFPLWAGIASPAQAKRVIDNLPLLEAPGGLMTSATNSGNQWDAPFAWAPLQLIAVRGMQNYNVPGAQSGATRIATKFVNQVAKEFHEDGGIFEKYDARSMESDVADGIDYGYDSNELGFGWTNGVFLELLDTLKQASPQSRYSADPNQKRAAGPFMSLPNPFQQAWHRH